MKYNNNGSPLDNSPTHSSSIIANELSSLKNHRNDNNSNNSSSKDYYYTSSSTSQQPNHHSSSPTASTASLRSYQDEIGIHILEEDIISSNSETSFERFWKIHRRQQHRRKQLWSVVIVLAAIALIISAVLFGGSILYYYCFGRQQLEGNVSEDTASYTPSSSVMSLIKDRSSDFIQTIVYRPHTVFNHLRRAVDVPSDDGSVLPA